MYKVESCNEGGTLIQLRNLINRRNVGKGKEVKHQVNEVEDFLDLVIRCHLVAAAMHHFGMSSVSDCPSANGFPSNIAELPDNKRKSLFYKKMTKIIDDYAVPRKYVHSTSVTSGEPRQAEIDTNPHLQRILLEHRYCKAGCVSAVPQRHLPITIRYVLPRPHAAQAIKPATPDGVFDYASAVLNDGLLLLEFKDAIREGGRWSKNSACLESSNDALLACRT